MAFFFSVMATAMTATRPTLLGPGISGLFPTVFVLHGITIFWIGALLVFYIRNVFKNDRVQKDKKALWAVVLFMGNMIAMPIYWYLYVWREA